MSDRARRSLADRASEIWKGGGHSYSEAVDKALEERNPTGSASLGERLLFSLLNVPKPPVRRRRHRPGSDRHGPDVGPGSGPSAAPEGVPAPDTSTDT